MKNQFKKYPSKCVTINISAKTHGVNHHIYVTGAALSPILVTQDGPNFSSLEIRTLLFQELAKNKILMPWIATCYRHDSEVLKKVEVALNEAMYTCRLASVNRFSDYLHSNPVKPVFRKFN